MEKIKLEEIVIVEGKYDKIRLESLMDAVIITTEGFSLFKNKEKQQLIRRLAKERGLLVLTDSDAAGGMIRNFIKGIVPREYIKHAYIPQLVGREKRKDKDSKEGFLGVEGMDTSALVGALESAGVYTQQAEKNRPAYRAITRTDLFDDGLIGGENSAQRRKALLKSLDLPQNLSSAALLETLNILLDREQYEKAVSALDE